MDKKFKERMLREIKEDIIKRYSLLLFNLDNNAPIKGRTRFMKELFLISKSIPKLEEESDFEAYNYGPSSDTVLNALEDLEVAGVVNEMDERYILTESGKEITEIVKRDVKKDEIELIEDIKRLCNDLSTDELLAIVYYSFPEMTIESIVKERIEGKREKIALNLLKKGKVSIGKASEIAGMSMTSFYKLLKKRGIKVDMGYP